MDAGGLGSHFLHPIPYKARRFCDPAVAVAAAAAPRLRSPPCPPRSQAHWDAEGGGSGESGGDRGCGARGGVNSGDSGGESDDAEGDSGDSGDGGGGGVHISHRACGDGELYVVSVAFAPSGGGKAPAKRHQFGTG